MMKRQIFMSWAIVLVACQTATSQVRRDAHERERPRFQLPDRATLPAVRPTAWGITTALKGTDDRKRAAALLDVWRDLRKDGSRPGDPVRFGQGDQALFRFGLTAETLGPALVPCLSSADPNVRAMALDVFSALGPGAASATAELVPLAASNRAACRWAALDALVSVQASPPVFVPLLLNSLKDPDESIRKLAREAVEAAFRQNAEDLEEQNQPRGRVFEEIPRERLDFRFTLDLLRPLLMDADRNVQITALHCLSELDSRALPLRPNLVPLLGDRQAMEVRRAAAEVLLRLEPDSHDAPAESARSLLAAAAVLEPDLILESEDERLFNEASYNRKKQLQVALGSRVAAPLEKILERRDQDRMYQAIRLLEDTGPQAPQVAPLLAALVDKDQQYWDEAACALASVDRDRRQYFPKLMGFYRENEGWPKFVFAFALSYYGSAAREVLPTLTQGPGRERVRFEPARVRAAIERIGAVTEKKPAEPRP